jgi:DNA primase
VGKKAKEEYNTLEKWKPAACRKVDVLYRLERKIIEMLLLYGDKTEEFEDVLLKSNGEGKLNMWLKKQYKVFHRIYLSLQRRWGRISKPLFRDIFNDLINYYLQNEGFSLEQYLMLTAWICTRGYWYFNGRRKDCFT